MTMKLKAQCVMFSQGSVGNGKYMCMSFSCIRSLKINNCGVIYIKGGSTDKEVTMSTFQGGRSPNGIC